MDRARFISIRFEDDAFIAGNASAGLEILEDLPDVDCVVAAFGGGGLSCGIAAALKAARTQGEGVCGRAGDGGSAGARLAGCGIAPEFSQLDGEFLWTACGGAKSVFSAHVGTWRIIWPRRVHCLHRSRETRKAMRIVAERNRRDQWKARGACAVAAGP